MTQTETATSPAAASRAVRAFPRYPAYRDSGVPWLGQVPAHWEVKRLKWSVSACHNGIWGDEPQGDDTDIACVRVADFDRVRKCVADGELTKRSVPDNQRQGRVLKQGDLLLEKSGGGELQPVGAVVLYDRDEAAVCSNFIARMPVAPGTDSEFLCYAHATLYDVRVNTRSIKQNTGIQNLDSDAYLNELAAFPPLAEQRAIAAFLDHETARLDALVTAKQRLIGLLREKRTTLINQVITRGLDPNTLLKDSGVRWLGKVPAHWTVSKLGALCRVKARLGWKGLKADEYVDEGYIFLSTPNIKDTEIDFENVNRITAERYDESPEIKLEVGDVLIAKDGSTLGITNVVRYLPALATVNSSIAVIRQTGGVDSIFLCWFLRSHFVQSVIQRMKDGMGVPHLFQADLRKFAVLLPPLTEQREIAAYLDRETAKLDALVSAIERQIERLGEYRTALIAAAVTGHIDVRESAKADVSE